MPIAFARASYIRRRLGQSSVQRLAYLLRSRVISQRNGLVHDYSGLGDLLAAETLLPKGSELLDHQEVWEAIETASARADAALGFELVLSLPSPTELDPRLSISLTRAFVQQRIVAPHSLAATFAVHLPHMDDDFPDDEENLDPPLGQLVLEAKNNLHAHIMVTPRKWTAHGPAKSRYTALDPTTRGAATVGRNWGRLWSLFQNEFFAQHAPDLRVRQNPPAHVVTLPLAEARRKRRLARKRSAAAGSRFYSLDVEREIRNSTLLTEIDNATGCFDSVFTRSELEQFHARHNPREMARELASATVGLGLCVEINDRWGRKWLAGMHQVQSETEAFARALCLGERRALSVSTPPGPWPGFRPGTQAAIEDILGGPDLVVAEIVGDGRLLLNDVARAAEKAGAVPVVVPTAAGHPPPKAIIRTFEDLTRRAISNAVILLDDVDSLTPHELSLVAAAAVAGGNKLVLFRRIGSDWSPLDLVNLIRNHAHVVSWVESGHEISPTFDQRQPRSAITLPLTLETAAFDVSADWPHFAMDLFGNLATSRAQIGRALAEALAFPPELSWAKSRQANDKNLRTLPAKVARWINEGPALQEPLSDVAEIDHDLEEAASQAWAAGEAEEDMDDDFDLDATGDNLDLSDVEFGDAEPDWDTTDDFGHDGDV